MHDEWQAGDRRYLSQGSMAPLAASATTDKEVVTTTELIPAQSPTQSLTRTASYTTPRDATLARAIFTPR
jgi:hypothetical protein